MIGIVGGVGPYAGLDLLKKIFDNTLAKTDQEHLDVILLSMSSKIEDRTEYLLGSIEENPGYALAQIILKLETTGAKVASIPCNTAHSKKIFDIIQQVLQQAGSSIKLLNMVDETIRFIQTLSPSITHVGVLSTTGTYKSGIYSIPLQEKGYQVILPTLQLQEDVIHPAIYHPVYGIKTISNPIRQEARKNLLHGIDFLKEQGAEAVILGCTEISLAFPEKYINGLLTIDPTAILARALINAVNPQKLKPLTHA